MQVIKSDMEKEFGHPLDISFDIVSDIRPGDTGKHRCIRSMISGQLQT